ncbi:MAG: OmpA family protein [Candidatus Kapaibacterium sp.]
MQRSFTSLIASIFILCLIGAAAAQAKDAGTSGSSEYSLLAAVLMPAPPAPQEDEEGILANKRIRIINLGPVVNHEGVDYAPTISADGRTLYFVSNRPGSMLTEDDDLSHDFWAARKNDRLDTNFFQPYNIDTSTALGKLGVNTPLNEGAASIAADRQSLYFTGCDRPDGLGSCDLYRTNIQGDKWGRPVNLGRNVNSKNFDSQPSIAPDQSRIYFISTRKGPNSDGDEELDNFDIWYCDYDTDLEEWKPAKNLEQINTPGIEASPFIAADNVTLFFASNGHEPNFGDLDFYVTRYDPTNDKWSKPENLGRPINTEDREQFISLPASGDIIYFSSQRTDLSGYQGGLDLFMAFVPTFFRSVVVKGTVVDECSQEYIPAKVTIKNPVTGRVINDTLTLTKNEFEFVVSNTDYGDPRDSIQYVDFQITVENEKYGMKSQTQRVSKPPKTDNPEELEKFADEIFVKMTLGQKPVLTTEIDEAAYIRENKEANPDLAGFRGLVMEEVQTWDLYPLLNYVFFPLGSAELPNRYILFDSPQQTRQFTDTTIAGGTLDKYYHILNIYGYRMKKNPDAKITITGCNDGTFDEEKSLELSKNRAQVVYDYFKNIWQIDESRMTLKSRNRPDVVSNTKDSLGVRENRRVEITSSEWEIMKPVFDKDPKTFPQPEEMTFVMENGIEDALIVKRRIEVTRGADKWNTIEEVGTTDKQFVWDWLSSNGKYPKDETSYTAKLVVTTNSGAECESDPIEIPVMQVTTEKKRVATVKDSTLERYSLILFPFDRSDAGPVNEKIMREYVYDRIKPSSVIEVIGHTDVVGLYEHNQKLSVRRSNTVYRGIQNTTKGKYAELETRGVGEDEPLYSNELPEGRFYNRTVQVIIQTPVTAWED